MFGRFGWAEILVVVVLVVILFGHNKIPGMMKNLADGLNVFKKELKTQKTKTSEKSDKKVVRKKAATKKK
ncbi:MAG: twin-arginine translocase TatA/TatE family subunit [Alphaproteobacteria bacterium]|nr:twin-arginine translocase TatA/TatE family subunit [Alphaproteobacteria bacterium]